MKFKRKILLVLLLLVVLFYKTAEVRAEDYCYYTGDLYLKMKEKKPKGGYIDRAGLRRYNSNYEAILNKGICIGDCSFMDIQDRNGIYIWKNFTDNYGVPKYKGDGCPQYVVVLYGTTAAIGKKHFLYAFDNLAEALNVKKQCAEIEAKFIGSCVYHEGKYQPGMTEEEYQKALAIGLDDEQYAGIDIEKAFDEWGDDACEIFGDVTDEKSLAYYIHMVLNIARIIAVALLITLGTIDMAKAVIASKEDEMKKAQKTFIRRIIICVVIFLIPTIVNIVMNFTDKQAWIKCTETLKY